MEKLSERVKNLNKISKYILKYGSFIVLLFFIVSVVLIRRADSVAFLNLAREFFCGNVYALCEVIIGALMVDIFIAQR